MTKATFLCGSITNHIQITTLKFRNREHTIMCFHINALTWEDRERDANLNGSLRNRL
jgi:hypothetical protein